MAALQKITPNLWFDTRAEDAARFYTSIFRNSAIGPITRFGTEGADIHRMPAGSVMTIEFTLEGQSFVALNGGPRFTFNEAISFIVNCADGNDVDYYWSKLTAGGDPDAQMCGWLKDKFGVSWQVVPTALQEMIMDKDREKAGRVMEAMLQMKKLDVSALEKAFSGR